MRSLNREIEMDHTETDRDGGERHFDSLLRESTYRHRQMGERERETHRHRESGETERETETRDRDTEMGERER